MWGNGGMTIFCAGILEEDAAANNPIEYQLREMFKSVSTRPFWMACNERLVRGNNLLNGRAYRVALNLLR